MSARATRAHKPFAAWVGFAISLGCAGSAAPAAAAPVTAMLADSMDIRRSTLIGRSGQIYEPSETTGPVASPRWIRRGEGGISASVVAAMQVDGHVMIVGSQTPLFRRSDGKWMLSPVGQRGRVVVGSGSFFVMAVGRQVFIHSGGRYVRVGTAPGTVVSLWASSETTIFLATDQAVFRRRGSSFVPAANVAGVVGFSGAAPHAIRADVAINLRTGARTHVQGKVEQVVQSMSTPAAIVRTAMDKLGLAIDLTRSVAAVEIPIEQLPTAAAIDSAGRALVASADQLVVYEGTTWRPGSLVDELPAPRPGPPPALSK